MKWIAAVIVVFALSCGKTVKTKARKEAVRQSKFSMACLDVEVTNLGEHSFGLKGCGKRWLWKHRYSECNGHSWKPATKKPFKVMK